MATMEEKERKFFWIFISPWIAGFVLFLGGPILAVVGLSFTNWDLLSPPRWAGLSNYVKLFQDDIFLITLKNTAIYAVGTIALMTIGALVVALVLNKQRLGVGFFRMCVFLPSVATGAAVALLFLWIYHPNFGILNYLLGIFGIKGKEWLFNKNWALPSLIFMRLWMIGPNMVIFLAALQEIPEELRESARMEGANWLQEIRHITLPLISPIILLVMLISSIEAFQVFVEPQLMTNGGPGHATYVYMLYLYQSAFEWQKMGYACSMALIYFAILFSFALLQFRVSRKWVHYA